MEHLVLLGKRGRKCYWESTFLLAFWEFGRGGALAVKFGLYYVNCQHGLTNSHIGRAD